MIYCRSRKREGWNCLVAQRRSFVGESLRHSRAAAFMVYLFLTILLANAQDQASSRDVEAVKAARESLESADLPWYDTSKDSLRRIDVSPPKDLTSRKSNWLRQPTNWSFPEWLGKILEVLGWMLVGFAVFAVFYALARAVLWDDWRSGVSRTADEALHGDIDRIEALPFQLQVPQADLLAEARRR
jgi:hypothetical protein